MVFAVQLFEVCAHCLHTLDDVIRKPFQHELYENRMQNKLRVLFGKNRQNTHLPDTTIFYYTIYINFETNEFSVNKGKFSKSETKNRPEKTEEPFVMSKF